MVSRVGHVALRVTDVARSVTSAEEIVGLRVTERLDDTAYLTCNARHHELMLIGSDRPGCDHLAFETFDPGAMPALRDELTRRKVPILDEPFEAGVEAAVRFVAPGGFVMDVFHGMETDQPAEYATSVNSTVKSELEVGPGHHGIEDNHFSYFLDADGANVEYSGAIQRIEDEATYVPRTWPDVEETVNRWGNPPTPPEFVAGGFPLAQRTLAGVH